MHLLLLFQLVFYLGYNATIHIYNTPLSRVTELFNFSNTSFILLPIKIHVKVVPFALNIAISFKELVIVNKS